MTFTLDVPPSTVATWNALTNEERERRARLIIEAIEAPRVVTWEELTGFTESEEEDFAANLGRYAPALVAPTFNDPEEDAAWERL